MSWWQGRRMATEAAREVAAHIEEKVADLVEAGMSEQEARHKAAREFGNAMLIAETSREVWSWGWLDRLGQAASCPRSSRNRFRKHNADND